jgi:hypothetical protein
MAMLRQLPLSTVSNGKRSYAEWKLEECAVRFESWVFCIIFAPPLPLRIKVGPFVGHDEWMAEIQHLKMAAHTLSR